MKKEEPNIMRKKQITKTKKDTPSKTNSSLLEEDGYKIEESKRKAVYRAKQTLPKEPKKIAQLILKLTASASPRKRKALEQENFYCPAVKRRHIDFVKHYQKEMQETKMKRSKYHKERRRQFGFSWAFTLKASQIDGIWEKKK